jgi:uncharacterized membrane protein YbhN (UPF0104 family)
LALASFCSLSLGHNIGFAALSSGAIRYRFYSRMGVSLADVAKIIVFCGVTVGLGLMTLGGLAVLINARQGEMITKIPQAVLLPLGVLCLLLSVAYVALAAVVRKPLRIKRWKVRMPAVPIALGQIAIGSINYPECPGR